MPTINPRPGRKAFTVYFRHPWFKKTVAGGLGTRDEVAAKAICRDIETLAIQFPDPISPDEAEAWPEEKTAYVIGAFDLRARKVFFGQGHPLANSEARPLPLADGEEAAALVGSVEDAAALAERLGVTVDDPRLLPAMFAALPGRFFTRFRKQEEELSRLEKELKVALGDRERLECEVTRLRRLQNIHVKVTLGEAFELWAAEYKGAVRPLTWTNATANVREFIATLKDGPGTRLAGVRGGDVDRWLASRGDLGPYSLKNRKSYLGSFFSWAVRRYDLLENPVRRSGPVRQGDRAPDRIQAIRRLEDLRAILKGLTPWPYWQALAEVALLAGPRYGELVRLRAKDVFLAEGYLAILASKTGRLRRVPIERTTLRPILKRHLETLTGDDALLFPSLLRPGENLPWSHNRNFLNEWRKVAVVAAQGSKADFWTFGPAEWRHTFGTVLGMCGKSSLEISMMMGNSEAVARSFYVAASTLGTRWPFAL